MRKLSWMLSLVILSVLGSNPFAKMDWYRWVRSHITEYFNTWERWQNLTWLSKSNVAPHFARVLPPTLFWDLLIWNNNSLYVICWWRINNLWISLFIIFLSFLSPDCQINQPSSLWFLSAMLDAVLPTIASAPIFSGHSSKTSVIAWVSSQTKTTKPDRKAKRSFFNCKLLYRLN